MNVWNKIVVVAKFVFGGFEAVTDYLLKLLNELLSNGVVADRIKKVCDYTVAILAFLKKYEKYCPAIWADDFIKLMAVIQVLVDVFADSKVTPDEAQKVIANVQQTISDWMTT